MKKIATWKRERRMLWVESELRLGYGDAWLAGGIETHPVTSCPFLVSQPTLIQWTSVLSAVVQRAVYPANVQLINLWSRPKRGCPAKCRPVARVPTPKAPMVPESPLFPSSPLMLSPWRREGLFLFLLQMASGLTTAFIKNNKNSWMQNAVKIWQIP